MSILANSTASSNSRSTSTKSPNSKTPQIKKGAGISVKRKSTPVSSTTPPSKKINSSTKKTAPIKTSASASFDLELTLCPICDEACTCPKTASSNAILVKSPLKKKKTTSNEPGVVVTKKKSIKKKSSALSSKKKSNVARNNAKNNKKQYMSDSEEAYYTDDENDSEFETSASEISEHQQQRGGPIEDPALSFIRMIYSDEESLDEEEAYALYQATQLFSSSSEDEDEETEETDYDSDDEYGSDSSESEQDFEYTVVEYVQPPRKKKTTEFVAYDSGESEGDNSSSENNLLLNTAKDAAGSDSDSDRSTSNSSSASSSSEEEENWMTYSVFDVDRDLALNHQLTGFTSSGSSTSLSCQGSGTPDTLLFSTSSADKIPNIAPQVLAAISAAAKHMAANQRSSNSSNSSSSKYFSYITLKDPSGAGAFTAANDEEEFLFFEEDAFENDDDDDDESDCDSIAASSNNCSSGNEEMIDISADDFEESFSDCSSSEDTGIKINNPNTSTNTNTNTLKNVPSVYNNFTMNRWNRVPIGAFRRSRRPSIPSYHHIHPATALKSFSTDPANFTLAAGEDSFDESTGNTGTMSTAPERSQSVITWDELDLDIVPANTHSNSTYHPVPKRSRSVAPVLTNNFEWLNSNWNWEI